MTQEHEPSAAREYVGRILAYFRQQAGMTQAELGRRIYCTDSLVAHRFDERTFRAWTTTW